MILRSGWHKTVGIAAVILLVVFLTGCVPTGGAGMTDPPSAANAVRTFFGDLVRQLAQAALL